MTRWYEEQSAAEWLENEISAEDYDQKFYRILYNEELLYVGACCMALHELFIDENEFKNRVDETMASADLRLDTAVFLVFNEALSVDRAQQLLKNLQEKNGIDTPNQIKVQTPSLSLKLNTPDQNSKSGMKI